MPSVNSSSSPSVWPSSTFTTPSLPTFSIASAMTSPISRSRDEMVATRAMSSLPETSVDCFLDTALERHRVGAGGHVLQALADDGLGEHGRGGRPVAGDVVRRRRNL